MRTAMVLLLLAVACGGRVGSEEDGGASGGEDSGASAPDTGGTGLPPAGPCPYEPPFVGNACTQPGTLVCKYLGGNPACQSYACDSGGHWVPSSVGC